MERNKLVYGKLHSRCFDRTLGSEKGVVKEVITEKEPSFFSRGNSQE